MYSKLNDMLTNVRLHVGPSVCLSVRLSAQFRTVLRRLSSRPYLFTTALSLVENDSKLSGGGVLVRLVGDFAL